MWWVAFSVTFYILWLRYMPMVYRLITGHNWWQIDFEDVYSAPSWLGWLCPPLIIIRILFSALSNVAQKQNDESEQVQRWIKGCSTDKNSLLRGSRKE